jgi:hypothetical protein
MSRAFCMFMFASMMTLSIWYVLKWWQSTIFMFPTCASDTFFATTVSPTRKSLFFVISVVVLLVALVVLCLASCLDQVMYRCYIPPHVTHVSDVRSDDTACLLSPTGLQSTSSDKVNAVNWKMHLVFDPRWSTVVYRLIFVVLLMSASGTVCIMSSFFLCDEMHHVFHLLWQQCVVFGLAGIVCLTFGTVARIVSFMCQVNIQSHSSNAKPTSNLKLRRHIRRHIQLTGSFIIGVVVFILYQVWDCTRVQSTSSTLSNSVSIILIFLWIQLTVIIAFIKMMHDEELRVEQLHMDIHAVCLELQLSPACIDKLKLTHPQMVLPWIPLAFLLFTCVFRSIAIHAIVVYCRCLKRRFPVLSE